MWIFDVFKNIFPREQKDGHGKGLIISPTDYRDVRDKDVLGAIDVRPLPEEYLIPFILPLKDQENTPACVGFACSTIKDEKERREKNEFIGDGEWLYKECKKVDGIPNVAGTYFRTGLDRLMKVGIRPTAGSPIQGDPANFRIGGYTRVDCDIESLKRAILQFGAVLAGFYGSNQGWNNAYIKPTKNIDWGHAVVLIGWDKDYMIGQNSWGNWGEKGLFYFDKNYLPFEAWAVLSDYPTQLLPTPADKPSYVFYNDLYRGMNSDEVGILQDCLVYFGCMTKEQIKTGYRNFGAKTFEGVKLFQLRHGINQTGYFGQVTRTKINELLK